MSLSGTIAKFFPEKGFGFIRPSDGGQDVFVHMNDNGGADVFENVAEGDDVIYAVEWDEWYGKWKATKVWIVLPEIIVPASTTRRTTTRNTKRRRR